MWHHPLLLLFAIVAGLVAGCVDAIGGGGGLIAVPALLSLGLPPAMALGTNRLQSMIGELTASFRFARSKILKLNKIYIGLVFTLIGSSIGTFVIQSLHPSHLNKILPFLLTLALIYFIFSNRFKLNPTKPRLTFLQFNIIFGLMIGFYNGFFGPNTGSFWMIAFMFFLAYDIRAAVIHTKPLNIIGNLASIIVFATHGNVDYAVGLLMGVGQIIGATIGANIVIYKSTAWIRPIVITIISIMTLYLYIKFYG